MAFGKATVKDSAGNTVGNNGRDAINSNNNNSGSPNSSTSQVAQQGATRNPDGTWTPGIVGEGSGRDPSRMNPVFAAKLDRLKNHPDYDNFISDSGHPDSKTYIDRDGRERLVAVGAKVDTTGWTRIDTFPEGSQRMSDFGPNLSKQYGLGYQISSDPNRVAYVDPAGNLITAAKANVPEAAIVVYNHDGTLSSNSVDRLGLQFSDGSPQRDAALDTERNRQERLAKEQYERDTGMRFSVGSAELQQFGEHEKKEYAKRNSPIGVIVGSYKDMKNEINRLSTVYIAPADPAMREKWMEENKGTFTADHYSKSLSKMTINEQQVLAQQQKNLDDFNRTIPGFKNWMESDFRKDSERRGEQVQQFAIGMHNEIREDPVSIAEMVVLSYAGGAVLGAGAGAAGKAITKLPKAVRPFISESGKALGYGVGLAGDAAWIGLADLNAQGKTVSFMGGMPEIIEITPGVSYERGSDPYMERLGRYTASDLIPGEIGIRKGFKEYYTPVTDNSALRLRREITADNMIASAMSNNPSIEAQKYGAFELREMNNAIRRMDTEIIEFKGSGKITDPLEHKMDSMVSKRDSFVDNMRKMIETDLNAGFFDDIPNQSVAEVEKSIRNYQKPDLNERAMNIYGGDMNAPEIRPGKIRQDELFVGNSYADEVLIGNSMGNMTQIFPGRSVTKLEIPNYVDDFFYPHSNRLRKEENVFGYDGENEYNYSEDQDFSNIAKRLVDNATGNKMIYGNGFGYDEENAHFNKEEYGFRFKDDFEFGFPNKFAPGFAPDFETPMRIPEFSLPTIEQPKRTSNGGRRKTNKRDKKSKNPILDVLEGF